MKACEVVRFFVNKAIVPLEPKRRGTPVYRRVKAIRILVYAIPKGLANYKRVVTEHLAYARYLIEQLLEDDGDAT